MNGEQTPLLQSVWSAIHQFERRIEKTFLFPRHQLWCSTDIGRLDIESKVKMEIYSYVLKVANHYPNSDYLDALLMPVHVMDGFERIHNNVDTDW